MPGDQRGLRLRVERMLRKVSSSEAEDIRTVMKPAGLPRRGESREWLR